MSAWPLHRRRREATLPTRFKAARWRLAADTFGVMACYRARWQENERRPLGRSHRERSRIVHAETFGARS